MCIVKFIRLACPHRDQQTDWFSATSQEDLNSDCCSYLSSSPCLLDPIVGPTKVESHNYNLPLASILTFRVGRGLQTRKVYMKGLRQIRMYMETFTILARQNNTCMCYANLASVGYIGLVRPQGTQQPEWGWYPARGAISITRAESAANWFQFQFVPNVCSVHRNFPTAITNTSVGDCIRCKSTFGTVTWRHLKNGTAVQPSRNRLEQPLRTVLSVAGSCLQVLCLRVCLCLSLHIDESTDYQVTAAAPGRLLVWALTHFEMHGAWQWTMSSAGRANAAKTL